jgi:polysaccharide export outer membrane protein
MRMNEGGAVARGRASTGDARFDVEEISPELVASLSRQLASERALIPDPQANTTLRPYTIAPYDVLQVTVWDHPELTTPTGQFRSPEENGNQVGADGTVFYPYAGVIPVSGKTVAEVRQMLAQRLAGVIEKPQLDVRIAAFRGKRIQVTGEVLAPSPMSIMDVPLRVQDAIAWAKGFTPDADLTNVTLTREGKTYQLDLLALYERGDLSQNWLLNDGDVVNVGDRNRNRVFVMGEVKLQQAKLMTKKRMTLAEALGDSGGLDFVAANTRRVYVIRGNYQAPNIYRLDTSSADALLLATHFELKPRDIVFVSTNELTMWNRVIAQILPTAQTLYDAAISIDVARRH